MEDPCAGAGSGPPPIAPAPSHLVAQERDSTSAAPPDILHPPTPDPGGLPPKSKPKQQQKVVLTTSSASDPMPSISTHPHTNGNETARPAMSDLASPSDLLQRPNLPPIHDPGGLPPKSKPKQKQKAALNTSFASAPIPSVSTHPATNGDDSATDGEWQLVRRSRPDKRSSGLSSPHQDFGSAIPGGSQFDQQTLRHQQQSRTTNTKPALQPSLSLPNAAAQTHKLSSPYQSSPNPIQPPIPSTQPSAPAQSQLTFPITRPTPASAQPANLQASDSLQASGSHPSPIPADLIQILGPSACFSPTPALNYPG